MKVETGEYLRLANGYIYKYENNDYEWIYEEDGKLVYGNGANEYEWEDDIKAHSFDIKDLIEVGDYVNGLKVIDIVENDIYISDYYAESYIGVVKVKDIKSIVTKENFSSMEYKVGE